MSPEQNSNTTTSTQAWICPVCGYIHYGPEPPDECPVCGSAKEMFEVYVETTQGCDEPQTSPQPTQRVIIAGAGIAGISAAEVLCKSIPPAEITLISDETHLPYYRLNLTRYLAGEVVASQLDLHPESWYTENNITLLRNSAIVAIDLAGKTVRLRDGQQRTYDKLILATGANPFTPPFPGTSRNRVMTLRSRSDAETILETAHQYQPCICIGGGILGLETAGALARQGLEVTVLENQEWLLPRQLDQTGSRVFQDKIKSLSITLHTQARTQELIGDEAVHGVLLDDGAIIEAGLVIISAGVRCNIAIAKQAGLAVNQGILVDDRLATSHPDVYAVGDVAEHQGITYGIWPPAQAQGTIAGQQICGQNIEFNGVPRSNTLKVLGVELFSIGRFTVKDDLDQTIAAELDGNYFNFTFQENVMAGSILLGDTSLSSRVKKSIEEKRDFSSLLKHSPTASDVLDYLRTI